ncbi:hypothetical protein [Arthrobacter sp. B1I2]|uniref:hypothetical protein n=1 Tax=Arthrobacter sp. B1I2 TaxID=3042263 RepID=UPI0027899B2A|nr:hypothetical protein [Arthrobacter sp. B1I2]MDQ0732368.1 hypothetical protein [Arthrobacter sp. B1I2]
MRELRYGGQGSVPSSAPPAGLLRAIGRFVLHFIQMCLVMCAGAVLLGLLFFGSAALLGYSNLDQRAPELTVLVIAISLSLPMLAWMRFIMGMAWRPTLEMAGSTMVAGLLLIVAYRLDLVARSELIPLQTGLLACPLMLLVMLFRFPLYSMSHRHHQPHAMGV